MSTKPLTVDTFISCGQTLIGERLIDDSEWWCLMHRERRDRNAVTVFNRHMGRINFRSFVESGVPDYLDEGKIPLVPDAQDYALKSNAIAVGFIEYAEITVPHRQYDGLQKRRRALLYQIETPLKTVRLCQYYGWEDDVAVPEEELEPEIIEGDNRISHYFPPATRPKKAI